MKDLEQWALDTMEIAEETDIFPEEYQYQNWQAGKQIAMALNPTFWTGHRRTMQAS